jgi:murein DD-endopeptidase MepM/ murein hydrolase activator NlpD
MRSRVAVPVCVFLWMGCLELPAHSVDVQAQALTSADPACDGQPRGTSCPSARGGESDQCDGQGRCVDCVSHIGCNESSVCDAAIQTCINFVQPPSPQCTGAPRGTPCDLTGGGSDPDYCDGIGRCIDCQNDSGCSSDRYCDLFGEICLLRTTPPAPPPPPPPPPPSPSVPSTARMTCDVFLSEGGGFDRCVSDIPEKANNIRFELFSSNVPVARPQYEWQITTPSGERLRIDLGCGADDRQCLLRISPRCDGTTGVYIATLRIFDGQSGVVVEQGTATATVTPSPCNLTPRSATAVIAPTGGTVSIPAFGSFTFPAGAFRSPQPVTLAVTDVLPTRADWIASAPMFGAFGRSDYELRLSTSVPPLTAVDAVFNHPARLFVPEGHEVQVFAQMFEDTGREALDQFELLTSTFSPVERSYRVKVPDAAFTNRRTVDPTFEAILMVSSTPSAPSATAGQTLVIDEDVGGAPISLTPTESAASTGSSAAPVLVAGAPDVPLQAEAAATDMSAPRCEASSIASPLPTRMVESPYNASTLHFGTDYQAAMGTAVRAMASGAIERVGVDERPMPIADYRSGKPTKGLGSYVVLRHRDGSRSTYAHLQPGSVSVQLDQLVSIGQVMAMSGDSGGSIAPHLHVAYAPGGGLYANPSAVDPDACMDADSRGSIMIRDNGSILDDAFGISLNGLRVCTTGPGGSNNCAIGNLRAGRADLGLGVLLAPDNAATYEITLGDRLTFNDSTTQRSGVLPMNGNVSFPVLIPVAQKTRECEESPDYFPPENPRGPQVTRLPFANTADVNHFGLTDFEPILEADCFEVCIDGKRKFRLQGKLVVDDRATAFSTVSTMLRSIDRSDGGMCSEAPRKEDDITRSIAHEQKHVKGFENVPNQFRSMLKGVYESEDACLMALTRLMQVKTAAYNAERERQDQHADHRGEVRYRQVCFGPGKPTEEVKCGTRGIDCGEKTTY